jgi:hypothetical protein
MSKDLNIRSNAATASTTSSRKPPQILDEDTYTEAIGEIVARDYFPTVASLKAQNEYLDALSSNDPEQLRLATVRLTEISTPQRRPAGSVSTVFPIGTLVSYAHLTTLKLVEFSLNSKDTRYNDTSWGVG